MTIDQLVVLLVSLFFGGLGLLLIGLLAAGAKPQPKSIRIRLQKGQHLPNSRYDESNFGH